MTLKEELEILRGDPIQVFDGDSMDIPCIETSDPEKLCKNPVVSVHMITYNHESYIRQAIEGVMMQKTDFEFELVIGEDCSQDKTRKICFEYQKKYPDKIRILWWHENVSKYGGNGRRNRSRCRGEFIALCEGDDYWTDPLKLQKQVDVMRQHPNVGLCYTNGRTRFLDGRISTWTWNGDILKMPVGLMSGRDFCKWAIIGYDPYTCRRELSGTMSPTVMYRVTVSKEADRKFDIMNWKLRLGDLQRWVSIAALSDVYFIPDVCVNYRMTTSGALATYRQKVHCDGCLVRLYFFEKLLGLPLSKYPPAACDDLIEEHVKSFNDPPNFPKRATYLGKIRFIIRCLRNNELRHIWFRATTFFWLCFCLINWTSRYPLGFMRRFVVFWRKITFSKPAKEVLALYSTDHR